MIEVCLEVIVHAYIRKYGKYGIFTHPDTKIESIFFNLYRGPLRLRLPWDVERYFFLFDAYGIRRILGHFLGIHR